MKKICFIFILCICVYSNVFAHNTIEKETLVYAVKNGQELHLDKFVDPTIAVDGKRPVMIYVHGGGFTTGSRVNALQIKYSKHFAAQGFVSVSIDYRLGIKEGVQADQETIKKAVALAVEDLIDATSFILKNADEWNIDTKKIIISGGSAGAITCLNAEYEICNDWQTAACLPAGFNFAGVISQAGCIIVPQEKLVWKKSPCPMLLMHGSKDQLVPFDSYSIERNLYAGSNYIHKQLAESDVANWLYEETGADHIVALKPLQYNLGEIDSFIDKFVLKGKHAVVHTVWADKTPDSMEKMFDVVPLYLTGWNKTDEEVQ